MPDEIKRKYIFNILLKFIINSLCFQKRAIENIKSAGANFTLSPQPHLSGS